MCYPQYSFKKSIDYVLPPIFLQEEHRLCVTLNIPSRRAYTMCYPQYSFKKSLDYVLPPIFLQEEHRLCVTLNIPSRKFN
jgi:hypothetical protein